MRSMMRSPSAVGVVVVVREGSSIRVTIRPCGSTHVATWFTGSEQTRSSTRVTVVVVVGAAVVVVVGAEVLVVVVCAQAAVGNVARPAAINAARTILITYLPLGYLRARPRPFPATVTLAICPTAVAPPAEYAAFLQRLV